MAVKRKELVCISRRCAKPLRYMKSKIFMSPIEPSASSPRTIIYTAFFDSVRSTGCGTYANWEATLDAIAETGGKAGQDWLQDKVRSGFAFQAICWEKSYIPLAVWRAGSATSNIIESVHSDVNREGVQCTLVGGVRKGQLFDLMKLRSLETREKAGITTSYYSGHRSENITKGVKRKFADHHRKLEAEDAKITAHNLKMQAAQETLAKKEAAHAEKQRSQRCTPDALQRWRRPEVSTRNSSKGQRAFLLVPGRFCDNGRFVAMW